jgi:hypothetical protein
MIKAMTLCLLIAVLVALKAQAFIKTDESRPGYRVKVDFSYVKDGRTTHVNGQVVIPVANSEWVPLTKAENGVALLGRLTKLDDDKVEADYMIIDTASSPVGVNRMGVVSKFGVPSEVDGALPHEKIKISMTATPTYFTAKPDLE